MDELHPPYDGDEVEDIKPDIAQSPNEGALAPEQAVRRELDTYGDSSLDPNREDQEDAHQAEPDEHV